MGFLGSSAIKELRDAERLGTRGRQLARHAPGLVVVVYEGMRRRREEERSRRKPKRKAVRLAHMDSYRVLRLTGSRCGMQLVAVYGRLAGAVCMRAASAPQP